MSPPKVPVVLKPDDRSDVLVKGERDERALIHKPVLGMSTKKNIPAIEGWSGSKEALAGMFDGDVKVNGDIIGGKNTTITCQDVRLVGQDCAENFDIAGLIKVEVGSVMVIGKEGELTLCHEPYDKKVTGVISGAGNYEPGLILGQVETDNNRQPIALLGKVYCKADAQYGAIEVGDMLTTSSNPGHAMKAEDPQKSFGAVIGKALQPLKEGKGLIPILICLQ